MRRLVDQLLDLSTRGEQDPHRTAARRGLGRIEELVQALAGDRAADVEISVAADLEALVDPNAFDRILSNLIVNAARYGSPPIEISAEQRDRHFRLTVADHGACVPAEFVPRLFERFTPERSLKNEARARASGSPLRSPAAQAHGGDLLHEPMSPHGARFRFVLPTQANG